MHDLIVIGGGPAALAATAHAVDKRLNVVMVYQDLGGKVGWRESLVRSSQRGHAAGQGGPHPFTTERYLHANEHLRLLTERVMHAGCVNHDQVVRLAQRAPNFAIDTAASWLAAGSHGAARHRRTAAAAGCAGRGADRSRRGILDRYLRPVRRRPAGRGCRRDAACADRNGRAGAACRSRLPDPARRGSRRRRSTTPWLRNPTSTCCVAGPSAGSRHPAAPCTLELDRGSERRALEVQRVFVALGLEPNSSLVRQLVEIDAHGCVIVDRAQATSLPGLFAAGDVATTGAEHVLIAIGDGVRAARSAHALLMERAL